MKTITLLFPLAATFGLSACVTTPEQSTAIGALGGAAVGAAVSSDDDQVEGMLVGAAAGAIAGTLIGQTSTPGQCYYRDRYGNRFIAACS
ncbi:MAG: glycine zipper 2TM domain-containing protein [Paracoccaceae bacterium]